MTLTAIVGATVIDGSGRQPLRDAVVLIDGDRIRLVSPRVDVALPDEATVIDGAGRYVIPGLIDANVHFFKALPDLVLQYEGRYAELIEEAAQVALRSGVTTVFDTWGPLEPLVAVRDRINRGEVTGSRMFVAGNIIGFDGPFSPDFYRTERLFGRELVGRINSQWEQGVGAELTWLTTEEVRMRVRDYIERSDVDFVKYGASAHRGASILFSEATQRAIVEEGHRAGLTVQAHTTSVESLRMEIEAGADILQHPDVTGLRPIPEEILRIIVDRQIPAAAMPWTERFIGWLDAYRAKFAAVGGTAGRLHEYRDDNDRRLIKGGARLLLTTDALVHGPWVLSHPSERLWADAPDMLVELGEGHFRWLEAVIERGMPPMEALLAATRNVADAYGHGAEFGTLEPGRRADLLILEADPLDDVRNYRRIAEVMKDGVLIDRDALPTRRILTGPNAPDPRDSWSGGANAYSLE